MPAIDAIEQKYLFRLTRFVALFFISIAIIPIIVGVVHYAKLATPVSTDFSKDEIYSIVKPDNSPEYETSSNGSYSEPQKEQLNNSPFAGLKLPFTVQKTFSDPENMRVLEGWLEPMNYSDREQFLNELDIVVQHAESKKIDAIESINKFWQEKARKLRLREENKVLQSAQNLTYAGLIGAAILTIAIFSLVLVLLAIERNTRKFNA